MWIPFALGRLRTGYSVAGQHGNEPGCRDPLAGLDRPARLAPRPERPDNHVPVESGLTERWVRAKGTVGRGASSPGIEVSVDPVQALLPSGDPAMRSGAEPSDPSLGPNPSELVIRSCITGTQARGAGGTVRLVRSPRLTCRGLGTTLGETRVSTSNGESWPGQGRGPE